MAAAATAAATEAAAPAVAAAAAVTAESVDHTVLVALIQCTSSMINTMTFSH